MSLKSQLNEDMKSSLRAKEADRLAALRLLLAAVRQKEIDERIELDDTAFISVVEKLIKQRKDSISQYLAASRQDLADKEQAEIGVLTSFMPQPFSDEELAALIQSALMETNTSSAKDMGKVMAWLKPRLAGRADMGVVSARIKSYLA